AGTWGNAGVRKGTHDYYNEHGLEAVSWDNRRFVALGDANMQPGDTDRAASAVRDSLAQLASALDDKTGRDRGGRLQDARAGGIQRVPRVPLSRGSGRVAGDSGGRTDHRSDTDTRIGAGKGALPRFRSTSSCPAARTWRTCRIPIRLR